MSAPTAISGPIERAGGVSAAWIAAVLSRGVRAEGPQRSPRGCALCRGDHWY